MDANIENEHPITKSAITEAPVSHREINILLMGETGVGKSTFINAFANYLTYANLSDAVVDDLISLISSKFTIADENYEEKTIEIGESDNESSEVSISATQNAKSYIFTLGDTHIRLIDTPGIGDTRGAAEDNINFEEVLAYLGKFEELNAICILLKPNNGRITVMFEYCIKQLLSRLEKSASRNIIFLFTNSRSTFYRPGDTLPPLKKILAGIENKPPHVKIPLGKQNIYCIDNEAFRFLVALTHGVQFSEREKQDFESSWKISSEECWRFLVYIADLKPHKVQNTLSVNEAQRLIMQPSQPLAEKANIIQVNMKQLKRQKEYLNLCADDVEQLKKNLYIPFTNNRVEELDKPMTVCPALKCCEVYKIVETEKMDANIENEHPITKSAITEAPVSQREINILLMGETGVGKSTFINAFANYLTYANLSDAVDDLISLIPSKFTVTDENYEEKTIEIGESDNESSEVGASATQNAKSYIFTLGDTLIRLIDTPGIGDTRGAAQDNINFEEVLTYLGEFAELSAICILLKPNNARITVMFNYCIKQLLSRLEKSASHNIVFLFTNSRSTFYRPGDTLPPLKKILAGTENKPPHVKIPLDKQNIYCIDNEAFRFLVALTHEVQFSDREKQDFESSWKISCEECWRFLTYVKDLEPHKVQNTLSVNEARRLIMQLSQPLAEIANLIQVNMKQLKRQKEYLNLCADDVEQLKKNLYIPFTNIRVEELDKPMTVCTALKCCEVYKINGTDTCHYKQQCHNPCSLKDVTAELIGSPTLIKCAAMKGHQHCSLCRCSYRKHMHIYYRSFPFEDNTIDQNIKDQILTKENAKDSAEKFIADIEQIRQEYEQEQDMIIKSTAWFAHFLQANAITAYNDSYESYLEYLIDEEKSLGKQCERKNIESLQNMLHQYLAEKETLDRALELAKKSNVETTSSITLQDVMQAIHKLYNLPHWGPKIKELFDKQNKAKSSENVIEREVTFSKGSKNTKKRFKGLGKTFSNICSKFY